MLQLGFSLKLYFDRAETLRWTRHLVESVSERRDLSNVLQVWVAPATPFLADVADVCAGSQIGLTAQNVDVHGRGAFTGGICAPDLADLGVRRVVVGHAERRAGGESDADVAAKLAACEVAGLEPVLCVGEPTRMPAEAAAAFVLDQAWSVASGSGTSWSLAYEPVWAIGASEPAHADHVREVCAAVRAALPGVPVLYGGSARPGLLRELSPDVDGLFLGRFAHDPSSFDPLLDDVEAASLVHRSTTVTPTQECGTARS